MAPQTSALTIVRNFDGSVAPTNTAGGGNLVDLFDAAADWWELAILDDFTLALNFSWAPLDTAKADHGLVSQAGGRETEGNIRFDNDESFSWFLDSTPHLNEEYQTFTEFELDLGGGLINVGRVWSDPIGDAVGRFDLLQTAKHEIGHALGMSNANTAYTTENADGDIDIMAPRPFAGAVLQVTGSHFTNALDNALMWGGGLPTDSRRLQSAVDILAMAEVSEWQDFDLDPSHAVPEPSTLLLLGSSLAGLAVWQRRRVKNSR